MRTRPGAHAPRLFAALAAGALLVGGCGDEGGGGGGESDFVDQANAICKEHTDRIDAAASKLLAGGELPSPRQFGKLAQGTIIPEYSAQLEELRALEPPEDSADAFDVWLDDSEALLQEIEADPTMIQDPAAFESVNAQADDLGLASDCQAGPSG